MTVTRLQIDVAFGAALILLGLAALLAFRSVKNLRSTQDSVVHTEQILREIESVNSGVRGAETAQRGYLLTGMESFLEPYRTAPEALDEGLLRLESLVADNPLQSQRARLLSDLVERRISNIQSTIELGEQGRFDAAIARIRGRSGQRLMDSISVVATTMADHEFALLEQRRSEEAATAGGTILFVLMGGVGAILIVATSRQSVLHELQGRQRAERLLAENQRYLRELYNIASSQELGGRERLHALVALGAQRFRVPIGVLVRRYAGQFEIVSMYDPGALLPESPLCDENDPIMAEISAGDGFVSSTPPADGRPLCFDTVEPLTWLRTPLHINGENRGMLAYLDPAQHEADFTDPDRDFLRLIAQWAGAEMERELSREELQQREERYRVLVESGSDLIFTTDVRGNFTYVNPVAAAAVGHPQEELLGTPAFELVHPEQREDMRRRLTEQVEKAIPNSYYEVPVITGDGRQLWLGHSVQLLSEDGVTVGLQSVARDITRQVEVERMKDEFLSVVSHELRTPLTAIRGSLGLLVSGRLGTLEPQGQRMLEIASHNTNRLVRLINDLLDIDKIESGKAPLQKERTDLGRLVDEAVEAMRPIADREGVRLEVNGRSVEVLADPDRILQVLTNLISNAVKFSSAGAEVRIAVESRRHEAVVSVIDSGRGVPADKLESIFERFQQVDSSDSRQKGGTGLGLAIVRQIVHQHGGEVSVESVWGTGSTFTFAIPINGSSKPSGSEESPSIPEDVERLPPSGDAMPHCDVLIVEDDLDLARVIAEMLRSRGISSQIATNGAEALEVSRNLDYDLLLLDPGLPGVDGFGVVEALREERRHREVPVFVYTTRDLSDDERAALRLGPTSYMTKSRHPLSMLEGRIATLLGVRSSETIEDSER